MSTTTTHDDVRIVDSFDDGGKPIRRAPMLGAFAGLVAVGLVAVLGGTTALWFAPPLVTAGAAAGDDLRSGRLPDRLVGLTALLGVIAAVAVDVVDGVGGVTAWLIGSLAVGVPLLAFHLASPCSMAFGDVKYAAAIGGLLGVVGTDAGDRVFLAMTALTAASAGAVLGALAVRSRQVPFGPWLFVGTCVTLVLAVVTRSPLA